jgi:hypothetical protein
MSVTTLNTIEEEEKSYQSFSEISDHQQTIFEENNEVKSDRNS